MKATIVFLLMVSLATDCSKFSSSKNNPEGFIGKWKLVETLADPGDGSGKWMPVSENHANSYVEFTDDGRLISKTLFIGYDQFHLNADSTHIILKKSSGVETQELHYQLSNRQLTINLTCIEPCGLRFAKVK